MKGRSTKGLEERHADLFEKLTVTLLAGAFIAPVPLYARGLLAVVAALFYISMVAVSLVAATKQGIEDTDDHRA